MYAINACLEMYRPQVERRLAKQLAKIVRGVSDPEFLFAIILVSRVKNAFLLLDVSSQQKIEHLIDSGTTAEVIRILGSVAGVNALKTRVENRANTLDVKEMADAIGNHNLGALGKERALMLLSKARDWTSVNEIIEKVIMPLYQFLDQSDIERIIWMPNETGADLIGATGYKLLITKIRETGTVRTDELDALLNAHGAGYLTTA